MGWLNSHLKSSIMSLLGPAEVTPAARENRTEDIRQMMLQEMELYGDMNFPKITRRVRFATDALGLWYARGDVMAVLSAEYGETVANEKMQRITAQFKGLLPHSMSARSTRLKN